MMTSAKLMAAEISKRGDWTQYSGHRICIQKMKKRNCLWRTNMTHNQVA